MQHDIISVAADMHQRCVAAASMMLLPIIRHFLRGSAEVICCQIVVVMMAVIGNCFAAADVSAPSYTLLDILQLIADIAALILV